MTSTYGVWSPSHYHLELKAIDEDNSTSLFFSFFDNTIRELYARFPFHDFILDPKSKDIGIMKTLIEL